MRTVPHHCRELLDTAGGVLFLRGPESPARDRCITHAKQLGILDECVCFLDAVCEDELIAAAN